jgi:cytochrome c551/c552
MKKLLIFLLTLNLYADANAPLYFNGNCTTCHFINKTVSAPSVQEFKSRYLDAFPDKKDFVAYMSVWVHKPQQESSLMHDAIAKHEIMPELAFDLPTLKIIAAYIYETDFSLLSHP